MARITESWQFSDGDNWTPADSGVLQRILAVFAAALNNVDNTNIADNAGIQPTKCDLDEALNNHAWTHHAGYTTNDPLDKASISGGMIGANQIGPWHIGIGAVTKDHFGKFDPLSRCFFMDPAPLSGTDGTVVPMPAGFTAEDGAKMVLVPAGFLVRSSASDTSLNSWSVSFVPAGSSVSIRAKAAREDESESCPITVYFFRLVWK